jgi:hypothetical protein
MDSEDDGEAWIWGDYVATLQKNPQTCGVMVQQMMNHLAAKGANIKSNPVVDNSAMTYHYATTVYYKKHKNPHGPSSQPILSVALEQVNVENAIELLREYGKALGDGSEISLAENKMPIMIGMFTSEARSNLGTFDEILSRDTARSKLFSIIRDKLSLHGEPQQIGNIRSILGHPETGWPGDSKNKKGGCLTSIVCVFSVFIVLLFCLIL